MLAFKADSFTGARGDVAGSVSSAHPFGPLLRIPPFPRARARGLVRPAACSQPALTDAQVDELLEAMRSLKVGGAFWGSQPDLPDAPYVLVRVRNSEQRTSVLRELPAAQAAILVTDEYDPWHLVQRASEIIVDANDELALIASIAGIRIRCVGDGRFQPLSGTSSREALRAAFRGYVLGPFTCADPFSGEPMSPREAIALCGFWRGLIDSNREIDGAVGFAFWKRATVAPLLWRGDDGARFVSSASGISGGDRIAVWKARTAPAVLSDLEARHVQLIEVEDGFIRSVGLGADCVPPLSIVVDRIGVHFDPSRPSELEAMLQQGAFAADLIDRARELRALIVASGLSKYGSSRGAIDRQKQDRRYILVPGQVEDDRAVLGSELTSNLELLRRVRADAPDAYILYKPHPDVEAGHRKGAIANDLCLTIADEIVRDVPISALLDLADEVHVNSSLAGFEALLREKPVTTHGVPFYAGWGLTRDLGQVPDRRTAKRTLDELVAAVLLIYPRYLDPVTGLPCPAEVLVRRLAQSADVQSDGILVGLRRLQGRCRRGLAALRQRA